MNALDRWIAKGALHIRRSSSRRTEIDALAVVDLAVEVARLREAGHRRAALAAAISRREAALSRGAVSGSGGAFPDQLEEHRRELRTTTAGERVARALALSRTVTKIAAAGAKARRLNGPESGEGWSEVERRPPETALDGETILRVLVEAEIDFVVIGGFAVGAHGYVRATKDVDIVPSPGSTTGSRSKTCCSPFTPGPSSAARSAGTRPAIRPR